MNNGVQLLLICAALKYIIVPGLLILWAEFTHPEN